MSHNCGVDHEVAKIVTALAKLLAHAESLVCVSINEGTERVVVIDHTDLDVFKGRGAEVVAFGGGCEILKF